MCSCREVMLASGSCAGKAEDSALLGVEFLALLLWGLSGSVVELMPWVLCPIMQKQMQDS